MENIKGTATPNQVRYNRSFIGASGNVELGELKYIDKDVSYFIEPGGG